MNSTLEPPQTTSNPRPLTQPKVVDISRGARLQRIAEQVYLDIHHDAITKPKYDVQLPHIHAHVMFLPQTEKGLRISLSNHNTPLRDGKFHDVLDEFRIIYQTMIIRHIHSWKPPQPIVAPSEDWIAFCNYCAARASLRVTEEKMPPDSLPQEFLNFVRTAGPEAMGSIVFRNEAFRVNRLVPNVTPENFRKEAEFEYFQQMENLLRRTIQRQSPIDYQIRTDRHSKIWNFGFVKGIQLLKPARRRQSRKAVIDQFFQGLDNRRFHRHIGVIGDCTIVEFLLQLACAGPRRHPLWFHQLEDLRAGRRPMPNQRYYQPPWRPPDPVAASDTPSVKQPHPRLMTEPVRHPSMPGPEIS